MVLPKTQIKIDSSLYKIRPRRKEDRMREPGKINYIEMPSKDLGLTKKFFQEAFGWSFIDYGPEYIAIADAGIDGGFYKSDKAAVTADGSVLVILYSDKLEAARDSVKAAGGTIIRDIFSFPGGRRFHFSDPNGNEYAVWSQEAA